VAVLAIEILIGDSRYAHETIVSLITVTHALPGIMEALLEE
jgi:hypothetical protein